MKLTIPEIFELVEKEDTKEGKIGVLRKHDSAVLRQLVAWAFVPNLKMNLPEGIPPFRHDPNLPYGYSDTNLYQEARRLYIFGQTNNNLSKLKIESLFIGILEGIHPKEAFLLCAVKDKDIGRIYPSITYELLFEALPGVLPEREVSVEVETKESPLEESGTPGEAGGESSQPKRRGRPKGSKKKEDAEVTGQISTQDSE